MNNKKTTRIFIGLHPGQTVSVPYKLTEPVARFLGRVRSRLHRQGIEKSSAKLFINGVRIDHYGYIIDHYRVFGDVFTFLTVDKSQERIQIYIRTIDNKLISHMAARERTIRYLKALLPPDRRKHPFMLVGEDIFYADRHNPSRDVFDRKIQTGFGSVTSVTIVNS
ncbi:hypothetical protein BX666DRAFT_2118686 [Dichotomocladium elegans]|nr:hypothetical protein BX666DRAFT_2118686 [Dichotomocladium elegans]